jgi:Flp pilus assembly protein TadG
MNMKMSCCSKLNVRCGRNRQSAAQRVRPESSKEKGQAMMEFALLLPVLLILLLGIIEFGRAAYYAIEVADAARAGAQYGSQSLADAANPGNIAAAAQNNAQDMGGALTVNAPQTACVCPGGGVAGSCEAALACCYPLVYLTVTTTYNFTPLFNYPGLPTTYNLTGSSTLPVQVQ